MPNYSKGTRDAMTGARFGVRVDKGATTNPQTTAVDLFTIAGGRVAMTGIVGEVTTIMGAVNNNTSLESNPTTGTTSAICAVLDTVNDEVGTLYGISGVVGDALVGDDAGGVRMQQCPVVLPAGTLALRCAANNTGATKWAMWYMPLDDGAYVTAA
jgi:hypothetical protein